LNITQKSRIYYKRQAFVSSVHAVALILVLIINNYITKEKFKQTKI